MPSPASPTLQSNINFTPELKQTLKALNVRENEYQLIVDKLGREPNFTELSMFSALWSEHCCYKHTRHLLKKLPTKGKRVLQGPGENAGVVDCGDDLHVAFKIESHNHPTAVEPFQGAATGVGGILRDIISMNARPVAGLNALRFGPIDPNDKNPVAVQNRYRFRNAIAGIGNYGNCIGVPAIGGDVYFEPTYNDNPLVNAMAIGVIQPGGIMSAKASGIGNPVLYVGSPTGRDGMGGAAFASRALDKESTVEDRPAVQVGDPFLGKLLLEGCLEAYATGCVVAAQDMGAAGLCCAAAEMSAKGDVGMRVDLDKVPTRQPGLKPFEYLLSETQERFVMVLEKGKEQPVLDVLAKWELPAVIIGEIIAGEDVHIYHNGERVADLPAKLLTDDAPMYAVEGVPDEPAAMKQRRTQMPDANKLAVSLKEVPKVLHELLGQNNIAQPKSVFDRYDRHVRNSTLVTSENNSAGVIQLRHVNNKPSGKAMAACVDGNARLVTLDPYLGTLNIMSATARNLIAMGAEPIGVTDNLNFGDPEEPDVYYQLYYCVEALRDACTAFDTPITGGNVSLYNHTSDGSAIIPSPVIGMVGLIEDDSKVMTPHWKAEGHEIALLGVFNPTLSGSEYAAMHQQGKVGMPPSCDLAAEAALFNCVRTSLIEKGLAASVEDVSLGGLLTCLSECSFATPATQTMLGFDVDVTALNTANLTECLFGETNGTFVISYPPENKAAIEAAVNALPEAVKLTPIGQVVSGDATIHANGETISLPLPQLRTHWQTAL